MPVGQDRLRTGGTSDDATRHAGRHAETLTGLRRQGRPVLRCRPFPGMGFTRWERRGWDEIPRLSPQFAQSDLGRANGLVTDGSASLHCVPESVAHLHAMTARAADYAVNALNAANSDRAIG